MAGSITPLPKRLSGASSDLSFKFQGQAPERGVIWLTPAQSFTTLNSTRVLATNCFRPSPYFEYHFSHVYHCFHYLWKDLCDQYADLTLHLALFEHFTGHPFKPHNDPMKDALLLPLLYRWGNWGTEKLTCPGSQSPKGTVKTRIRADSRFYCNYCAISLMLFIFRHLFIKPHLSRWKGIIPSPANEKLKSSETEAPRITENF